MRISDGISDVCSSDLVIYDKLLDAEVDVGEVYTTDGQIADYDLVLLEDDLSFFPVYEAAPLVRTDSLDRHPELREAIEALAGKIDAETMRALNSRVDIDGHPVEKDRKSTRLNSSH